MIFFLLFFLILSFCVLILWIDTRFVAFSAFGSLDGGLDME